MRDVESSASLGILEVALVAGSEQIRGSVLCGMKLLRYQSSRTWRWLGEMQKYISDSG